MPDAQAHLYVYYRIVADTPEARASVERLLADVDRATRVKGRLLARCEDPSTWMEIYGPIDDVTGFSRTLASLVEQHGVAALASDGRRRAECFAPLSPTTQRA